MDLTRESASRPRVEMNRLINSPISFALLVLFASVSAAVGVVYSSLWLSGASIVATASLHQLALLFYNGSGLGMLADTLLYGLVSEIFCFIGMLTAEQLDSASEIGKIRLVLASVSLTISLLSTAYINVLSLSPFCLSALVALGFFLLVWVISVVVFLNYNSELALEWFVFMAIQVGLIFQGLRLLSLMHFLQEYKIVCNVSVCCIAQYFIGYVVLTLPGTAATLADRVFAIVYGSVCFIILIQIRCYYREIRVLSAQISFSESVVEGLRAHAIEDPKASFELEHVIAVPYQHRVCYLDLREVRRAVCDGSGERFNTLMTLAGAISEESAQRASAAATNDCSNDPPGDWFSAEGNNNSSHNLSPEK